MEHRRGPRRSVGAAAALAAVLAAFASGCSGDPGAVRRSVLLVVLDTTRGDDWPFHSGPAPVTPNLDALARGGLHFTNAWSLYSVTVPSHVSLFTGHAAIDAGDPDDPLRGDSRYAYERSSLFAILSRHGYRTYAFAGNRVLGSEQLQVLSGVHESATPLDDRAAAQRSASRLERYGAAGPLDERFSSGELYRRRRMRRIVAHDAEWVTDQAIAAMRRHADRHAGTPYLLFVNYVDPHDPYFPPEPWATQLAAAANGEEASRFNGDLWSPRQRSRVDGLRGLALSKSDVGLTPADVERARTLHRAEVAHVDHQLGRLLATLEELGLLDSTAIVVTSDHGEAFGEEGRMAHGGHGGAELERALLQVPLVMRLPGADGPARVLAERVDLRDVKPTLLEWLGVPDEGSRGRSLLPLVRGVAQGLPPAAERPQDRRPEAVGEMTIGGQDPATDRRLEDELRALGYLEGGGGGRDADGSRDADGGAPPGGREGDVHGGDVQDVQ